MMIHIVTLLTFDTGHTTWHYDKLPAAQTKAMFARERRSRERYNCCVAEDAAMPVGSFFEEEN